MLRRMWSHLRQFRAVIATCLKSFVDQFASGERTGVAIDDNSATIFNDSLNEKLNNEKLESVQEKYLKPQNCEDLAALKINKQMYSSNLGRTQKISILNFKKFDNCLWAHCMLCSKYVIFCQAIIVLMTT